MSHSKKIMVVELLLILLSFVGCLDKPTTIDIPELFSVQKDGKYGIVDSKGNIIAPTIYDEPIYFINEKVAKISKNKKYGVIDKKGRVIVPVIYDYLFSPLNLRYGFSLKSSGFKSNFSSSIA